MPEGTVYVTPGHPVKEGAGYDCVCGQCLHAREQRPNLATLVGYVVVEQCPDGTRRLASGGPNLETDINLARQELTEWLKLEAEVNGRSTYVLAEVHEVGEPS